MAPLSRRKFLTASGAIAAGAAGRFAFADAPPRPGASPAVNTQPLAAGNTRFGLDLYGQLRTDAGNLFLSPFSISTALAMAAAGARGKTQEEMTSVLRLPADAPTAFGAVIRSLNEVPPGKMPRGFDLSTANALWAQQGYPWKDEYKKLVTTSFEAGLHDVDFKSDPEKARAAINHWVEKETREKIRELLQRGVVTPDTRLVLTNAIYFKGDWNTPFKKEATKDEPFHLADGGKVDAPLMHRTGGYRYGEADGFQTVELPYRGHRLSMLVVLPKTADGLPAVEKELTTDRLAAVLKGLRYEGEVKLWLPRFKVEKDFTLNKPLSALGMTTAFTDAADFSGMSNGGERLSISAVVHKAYCDVNEEGTEAAAATGVVVGVTSIAPPPVPRTFRADRPFLFLIRDAKTDSVLFLGRVTNPKG